MVTRIPALLRREPVGGALLVVAAVAAIVWANSPAADTYFALRDFRIGYEPWHLNLTLGAWAGDGLLAIFFFLVGLELKRELVVGDLRHPRTAVVPVAAAVGGVAVPALIYLAVVWQQPDLRAGWAIPTATDIAFAVAVLALIGSHLPPALRLFLLTLAVVDDLIAIVIIAVFYTDHLEILPLIAAAAIVVVYGAIAHRWQRLFLRSPAAAWLVLLPIGIVAWAFLHASGIHATIAGVALAFAIPVRAPGSQSEGLADAFEHRFRPLSSGFAVPVFAFFAAGVTIGPRIGEVVTDPVAIGIAAGLVLGKPLGIVLTTRLVTALTPARLDASARWLDVVGVGALAGIGFTVSLLITELSFAPGTHQDAAKVAILLASVVAVLFAAAVFAVSRRRASGDAGARGRASRGSAGAAPSPPQQCGGNQHLQA